MKCRVFVAIILLLGAAPELSFSRPRPFSTTRASWTMLNNCVYVSNQANDGDSFHVRAGGKEYLLQAKYFGVTTDEILRVGKITKNFTREKLSQPFTVRTCFQDALGRSRCSVFMPSCKPRRVIWASVVSINPTREVEEISRCQ